MNKLKKIQFTPLYSLLLALFIGGIIILISGNNPFEIYSKLLNGAFGSRNGIMQTLLQSTPLIFCGLSVAVGMRGGLLNLGVEGQLYIGALCSSLVGLYAKGLPSFVHITLCILAGMVGGAVWAFLPVFLKIKRGTHEVVTALMLNYIASLFIDYMTNYPLMAKDSSVAQSEIILPSAFLPKLVPRSQVSCGILIGVVLAILLSLVLKKTVFGYSITLVGQNQLAAKAAGVPINKIMISTMLIAGACAGLAGTVEVLGTYNRLIMGFSPGYGFDGIAVAVLGSSPIMVIFSALLFGALRAGGMALQFGTNLSVKFITALQGIIILLIAAPALCTHLFKALKISKKSPAKEETE
ncbi:MAG: ABC transporter permease [Hydrogenoanaerobacterium sp.]